jgi:hypothetical protein
VKLFKGLLACARPNDACGGATLASLLEPNCCRSGICANEIDIERARERRRAHSSEKRHILSLSESLKLATHSDGRRWSSAFTRRYEARKTLSSNAILYLGLISPNVGFFVADQQVVCSNLKGMAASAR